MLKICAGNQLLEIKVTFFSNQFKFHLKFECLLLQLPEPVLQEILFVIKAQDGMGCVKECPHPLLTRLHGYSLHTAVHLKRIHSASVGLEETASR